MQQQSYAYESKFQKFYLIRIIQLFQEKAFKIGFREIKKYATTQPNEKKFEISKQSQQIFDGEIYISTKEYAQIYQKLPKIKMSIDLQNSNQRLNFASVTEIQSLIQQNEQKQQQEIITQRAVNKFLQMQSIQYIGQNQINSQPKVNQQQTKKYINQQFSIKLLLALFIISSIYILLFFQFERQQD